MTTSEIAGRSVYRVEPRSSPSGVELLYLHGGAYVNPMESAHWWIIDALVRRTGASVTVPLYGLAPEHDVQAAMPFLDAVYAQVVDRAGSGRVVVAGDSCGAALAVAQAIRLRDAGARQADHLLLFSPWLEATMADPQTRALDRADVMSRSGSLAEAARAWAGTRPVYDPMVSPITDGLAGLTPMSIYQGGYDVCAVGASRFTAKACAAGTDVDLHEYPDAFHVFAAAWWTPEARHALDDAAAAALGRQHT